MREIKGINRSSILAIAMGTIHIKCGKGQRLTFVGDWTSCLESDIGVTKSEGGVSGWGDFGFNLCVAPFPNVYVPNFKLEDVWLELSELAGGQLEW